MNKANGTVALTNVVNLLLHKEYDSEVTVEANKKVDVKDVGSLTAFITEALSMCFVLAHGLSSDGGLGIDPPFAGVYRVAKQDESIESLNVRKGERLFLHIASANMNVSEPSKTAKSPLSRTNPTGRRVP